MPLRRYQPIAPSAQWSETVTWTDPRTREINSLDGAVLTMALYQRRCDGFRDYGRVVRGRDTPILSAQTMADGSGPFFILPDQKSALFVFPAGTLAQLCSGEAHLVVWATVDGATDVITDAVIPVEDGPRAMPPGTALPNILATPSTAPRIVTGIGPAQILPTDSVVLLNGPTQVFLEASPRNGIVHVVKDRGSLTGANAITITPSGSDTIDGAPSLSFSQPNQAAAFIYVTGEGWSVY